MQGYARIFSLPLLHTPNIVAQTPLFVFVPPLFLLPLFLLFCCCSIGFSLNPLFVSTPLPQSNYNQAIVDTLNKKPEMFWYFNNGITAISKMIKPVGFDSQIAELRGLQIINGAQTVYSVYSAYKNANEGQREIMDLETKINLRLIRSNNDDMNLEITRYTNSQKPMEARDFWANDEVQIRLQEESFKKSIGMENAEVNLGLYQTA
jgi:hypothetical protein